MKLVGTRNKYLVNKIIPSLTRGKKKECRQDVEVRKRTIHTFKGHRKFKAHQTGVVHYP